MIVSPYVPWILRGVITNPNSRRLALGAFLRLHQPFRRRLRQAVWCPQCKFWLATASLHQLHWVDLRNRTAFYPCVPPFITLSYLLVFPSVYWNKNVSSKTCPLQIRTVIAAEEQCTHHTILSKTFHYHEDSVPLSRFRYVKPAQDHPPSSIYLPMPFPALKPTANPHPTEFNPNPTSLPHHNLPPTDLPNPTNLIHLRRRHPNLQPARLVRPTPMAPKNDRNLAAAPRLESWETKCIPVAVAVERSFAGVVGEAVTDGLLAVGEYGTG